MEYKPDVDGRWQGFIGKKTYLTEMLGRLENEAGQALEKYKTYNEHKESGFIGFWGLVRLIMPVIESYGKVEYSDVRDSWDYSSKILRRLGVPYPKLSWKLFRDCLIHGDELLRIFDDSRKLYSGWKINIGGGHERQKLNPCIDLEKLYEDLYREIKRSIEKSNDTDVIRFNAIRFSNKQIKEDSELEKELNELFG